MPGFEQSGEYAGMARNDDLVNRTLDALERLMRMFAAERILYLVCAAVSFVLLMIFAVMFIKSGKIEALDLGLLFGASGLIAASTARVSFFLNKSFDLISAIIEQLAGIGKKSQ
jgi:hypothetical protein